MFKLRSIAARLILAISLTVAAACGILGTFSIMQQRSLTQLALDQQLKLQYDSVIAAIDYEGRAALAVSAVIATLPPVGDAIAKGDRDALAALLWRRHDGAEGARHPADHLPHAAGDRLLPGPRSQDCSATTSRRGAPPWWRRTRPANRSSASKPGRDSLGIFAMTPIMRDGKSIAVADIGVAFGKEFVDRAKQRFGVDLAVHWFDGKTFTRTLLDPWRHHRSPRRTS